jgi:Cu(I)/Ag(I) efflux system membrane fusion protein
MKNAVLLLAMIAAQAYAGEQDYQWAKVETASSSAAVKATGRMIPQDGALNIESARIQGRVLSILKREGEKVAPGTPLFSISSAECFSLNEEKKVATDKKIGELIEGVAKRERQLALSVDASNCRIVATHSGVVTKRNIESGGAFNPGDPLVTILDTHRLTAELDVPERDLGKVRVGQTVHFKLAADANTAYTTKISDVVPTIDATSRTTKVRLQPVRLSGVSTMDALIFGDIETGTKESILKVPSEALVFAHNRQYVIKGPLEKAAAVEVQLISEEDDFSSIRPKSPGDLADGDQVASRGAIFLMKKIGVGSSL